MNYYTPAKAARYLKSKGMDYMAARQLIDATKPTREVEIPGENGFFSREYSEEDLDQLVK